VRRSIGLQAGKAVQLLLPTSDGDEAGHGGMLGVFDGAMKPTKPEKVTKTYERPTPKMSRLKRGKVLSVAERDAFLASRPDLKKPS